MTSNLPISEYTMHLGRSCYYLYKKNQPNWRRETPPPSNNPVPRTENRNKQFHNNIRGLLARALEKLEIVGSRLRFFLNRKSEIGINGSHGASVKNNFQSDADNFQEKRSVSDASESIEGFDNFLGDAIFSGEVEDLNLPKTFKDYPDDLDQELVMKVEGNKTSLVCKNGFGEYAFFSFEKFA